MFVNINILGDIIALFKFLYAFIVLDYKECENNLVKKKIINFRQIMENFIIFNF